MANGLRKTGSRRGHRERDSNNVARLDILTPFDEVIVPVCDTLNVEGYVERCGGSNDANIIFMRARCI